MMVGLQPDSNASPRLGLAHSYAQHLDGGPDGIGFGKSERQRRLDEREREAGQQRHGRGIGN